MLITLLTAHEQAWTRCGILHGDVSTGNILTCPRVEHLNGRTSISIRGILADWELAKRPTTCDSTNIGASTQAERIVSTHVLANLVYLRVTG